MRIVFMGTATFAVPCLKSLLLAGHDVAAAFTQPDRAKGRGHHLTAGPVKLLAEEYGVPVYQPVRIKEAEYISILKELNPEIIVVVAYGQILPENILQLPPYGCINVHGSLLPRYRG
ncbi:MAG: methionyl-tRNA formyltransferase, partial [Methylocystaceae bacterium]